MECNIAKKEIAKHDFSLQCCFFISSTIYYSYLCSTNQNLTTMIDYIIGNIWQTWTVIAIICLVVEISSGDFYFVSFSIGAAATAIAAALGCPFGWSLGVFALASVLSLFFIRPLLLEKMRTKDTVSNADAIIGKRGRVTETIEANGGYGRVAVGGDDWKAQSVDGAAIEKGTFVIVRQRESIIVTVEPE